MYFLGHLGIALLCFAPLAAILSVRGLRRAVQVGAVGFVLTASAPDVDLLLATVPHRGITHTVVAAVTVGLAFGVVGWTFRPAKLGGRGREFCFAAVVGTLGTGTHLLGDVITPMGIRPFAPVSDASYTFSLVYASDAGANAGLLVTGVLTLRLSLQAARLLSPMLSAPVAESAAPTRGRTAIRFRLGVTRQRIGSRLNALRTSF